MFAIDRVFVRSALAFALISSLTSTAFSKDPWPAFRGPDGNGIADNAANPPSHWSAKENIDWRTELPGEGWSSPVVGSRGRIYLSAAIPTAKNSKEYDLSLLIVDESTGILLDQVVLMRQTVARPARVHKKNSHASPTPVLSKDWVFVHFGHQGTACASRDGGRLWTNRDLFFQPTHGNGGTPILVDDLLVFTCDGDKEPKIVALDTRDGHVVWQTPRPIKATKTFSFCTPTLIEVNGRQQIIAPGSDNVLALDPKTGRIIWDVRYDGYSVVPKPVFDDGLVFLSTSFDSSKMLAIRPDGRGNVTDSHVEWQQNKFVPKTPSMIAHEGRIYSVSDNGIMTCVDAASGDIVYRERLGGNFSASPILVGDRLYFTSEEGVTTVVKTGDRFRKIAENDLGERTLASMAVSGDALIMRTADALYRIKQ